MATGAGSRGGLVRAHLLLPRLMECRLAQSMSQRIRELHRIEQIRRAGKPTRWRILRRGASGSASGTRGALCKSRAGRSAEGGVLG